MMRSKGTVASAASELDRICTLASPDINEATLSQIRQLIDITSERSEIDPTWCVIGMLGGTGAGERYERGRGRDRRRSTPDDKRAVRCSARRPRAP